MYVGANDGMLHGVAAGSFVDPNPERGGRRVLLAGQRPASCSATCRARCCRRSSCCRSSTPASSTSWTVAASAADVWIDYNLNGVKEGTDWTTALLTPLREGGESRARARRDRSGRDVGQPRSVPALHVGVHAREPGPDLVAADHHAREAARRRSASGDRCGVNNGDGDCVEEWVAIFGAGYRPQGDPNLTTYTNDPNNPTYTTQGTRRVHGPHPRRRDPREPPAGPEQRHLLEDELRDSGRAGGARPELRRLRRRGVHRRPRRSALEVGPVGDRRADVSGVVPTSHLARGRGVRGPGRDDGAAASSHYHSIFQSAAAAFNDRVLTLSFASGERANLGYRGEADPNDPNSLVGLYDDNNRFWVLKDRTPTGTGAFPTTLPIYEEPLSPATVPLPGHGNADGRHEPGERSEHDGRGLLLPRARRREVHDQPPDLRWQRRDRLVHAATR